KRRAGPDRRRISEALSGPISPRPSVLRVSLENAPSVEQVAPGAPDHNRARSASTNPPPTELRHKHTEQQKPPQRAQAPPDPAGDKAALLTHDARKVTQHRRGHRES